MKLPVPSLFAKKAPSNYYLALLLRSEKTIAVVLQEIEGRLKIIGSHESSFSTNLEQIPFEELLETLDKTISRAEEMLPPNIETEKTVFGVKEAWVEEKKIKKEHLVQLKKVCESLSLQPIGFMVITEAISHLLSEEEGAPLSAILTEIGKNSVTLTLFRASKILETHSGPIEGSITQTVDRLLHHFTIDVLPSRMIILDENHDEALAQEFLAHHWSKSIPFLHVPQISLLPAGFDGKAMIYGAGEQMGFSVQEALGDIKVLTIDSTEPVSKLSPKEKIAEEAKPSTSSEQNKEELLSEDLKEKEYEGKDILNDEKEADVAAPLVGDNFGFVMNEDITKSTPHTEIPLPHKEESIESRSFTDTQPAIHQRQMTRHEPLEEEDTSQDEGFMKYVSFIPAVLSKFSLPALPLLGVGGISKRLIILPAIIVLLLILGLSYLFAVKATVTLHMEAKKIDDSTTITLRTDSENDLAQKILTAKEVETSVDGTVSTAATGKKDVGEKAKGTITLYNNSDSKKTISSGTTISSSNNLDFVTTGDIAIASASGDATSSKPGTASVGVTAKNIGSEYNLPSGTKFSIDGISSSSLAGKNDSAFSGGSKKTVTVVAKKDTDTLTEDLTKQIEGKAKDTLKDKAGAGQQILPIFTGTTLSKKSFDNDVGDEASKVTLKGTITFTTLSYNTEDLGKVAQAAIQGKYDKDLALSNKGIVTELQDIKPGKNGEATASLVMDAGLLPKIDEESVTKNITGKSFDDATAYLQTLPQVSGAEIQLSPSIPLLPKLLPRFTKNIKIVLQTND
jgi:hypothetical protein